jgi:hypothetical protein
MIVKCPNCGQPVAVKLGRKRLNISLKKVSESLQAHRSIAVAAQELGCSEGYIFGVLKANGLKLKDVLGEKHCGKEDTK